MRERTAKGVDWYLIGAIAAGLFAVLLQAYRLGAPLSGYHGYNESYYFTSAIRDLSRGALAPVFAPQDVNNPFAFPLLLVTVLRVFGPSIAAGRAISLAASFATVLLTYWVGRQLYDRRVGLVSAVVIALTPGLLLTGRNIQLDPLMLMFEMAAVGAYLKATSLDSPRWAIVSGALFGLGLLTKLPILLAVLSLAIWKSWITRSWRWLTERPTWMTALSAAIVSVPWYAYSLARTAGFESAQAGLLARTGGWSRLGHLFQNVFMEQFWMLSPVLTVLAVAGLILMARERDDSDKLVLVLVAVHVIMFAWNNKHSYYFTPLLPWACIAAGVAVRAATDRVSSRSVPAVAVAVVLCGALMLPFSIAELSSKKWSMLRVDDVAVLLRSAGYAPEETVPLASTAVEGGLGPAVDYYLGRGGYARAGALETWAPEDADAGRHVALAGPGMPVAGAKEVGVVPVRLVSPVLFGWAIRSYPGRFNYYSLGVPELKRVGSPWRFGTTSEDLDERVVVLWGLPSTPQ